MSGGVDSAAAAQLALDAGDEVVAVTLELWSDPGTDGEQSCCSPQAVLGARDLAHRMGIPHVTLDLRERFRAEVVDRFLDGYAAGRTPNPCVRCNGEVRFDAMLELAGRARARPARHRPLRAHRARRARARSSARRADPRKDQSYMLAKLDPALLDRLSFPLGGLTKDAVRALAREAGLPGGRQAREPGPLLRRRPRRPRVPPAPRRPAAAPARRDRRPRGTCARPPRGPAQLHGRPAPRPGPGEPRAALRAEEGRGDATAWSSGRRRRSPPTACASRTPRLHRAPREVETVRLRYHAEPLACRGARPGQTDRLELELDRPANGVGTGAAGLPDASGSRRRRRDHRRAALTPPQNASTSRRPCPGTSRRWCA